MWDLETLRRLNDDAVRREKMKTVTLLRKTLSKSAFSEFADKINDRALIKKRSTEEPFELLT